MSVPRAALAWLLVGLVSPVAAAAPPDRQAPIHIKADEVTLDERQGVSYYRGDVELTQGGLRMTADTLTVHQGEGTLQQVVGDGSPATFSQQPEGAAPIRAEARHLEYSAAQARLVLTGEAHVWQGENEFSGHRIVYHTETQVVEARRGEGGEGRVHAIIVPEQDGGRTP